MDLMKVTTTYKKLQDKYEGMDIASYKIKIDGTEIVEKYKCEIMDLTIDLTCEYKASACTFSILNEYDLEKSGFKTKSVYEKAQIGAKVEILLGYITVEPVYTGYINSVSYSFTETGTAPAIKIECMDAKCLLMKTRRLQIHSEKKFTDALTALLGEKPASNFIVGKEVESIAKECPLIRFPGESDYDFIVRFAKYFGCEFFIIQGKVHFRKVPKSSSEIMKLQLGAGLLELHAQMNASRLTETVTVAGIDPTKDEAFMGEAKLKGNFSAKTQWKKAVSGSSVTIFDEAVATKDEAAAQAQIIVDDLQKDFMTIRGICVGIPEIGPGRTVTFERVDPALNKTFYITDVRHTIDMRGFKTEFRARKESV